MHPPATRNVSADITMPNDIVINPAIPNPPTPFIYNILFFTKILQEKCKIQYDIFVKS